MKEASIGSKLRNEAVRWNCVQFARLTFLADLND